MSAGREAVCQTESYVKDEIKKVPDKDSEAVGDVKESLEKGVKGGESAKKSLALYLKEATVRREEGMAVNKKLLQNVDKEAVENIQQKQMEIVGAEEESFLARIDSSLAECRLEPFFLKEQWDLFAWREKFFHDNFPDGSWFTDGEDDAHDLDTIPMQVTTNFDEVMALASSDVERTEKDFNYFANNELVSARVRERFDRHHVSENFETNFFNKDFLDDEKITFGQVANMIVELHTSGMALVYGNKQKEEIDRMKETIKLGKDITKELMETSEKGFFSIEDEAPDFLAVEGKKLFNKLKSVFNEDDTDSGTENQ